MAKKKTTKKVKDGTESTSTSEEYIPIVIPTPIVELSVDFPSEGLNNMARKINEIIIKVNTL